MRPSPGEAQHSMLFVDIRSEWFTVSARFERFERSQSDLKKVTSDQKSERLREK
jgi:hypothetical protein